MKEQNRNETVESSQVCYETLEAFARMNVQQFLQWVLEEEVTALLGRKKHGRREVVSPVDPPKGSRNGHGKARKFAMMNGTVTVRRPRVRDLEERFASKVLPLFKRRSQAVGDLLPELYLHGLSTGTSHTVRNFVERAARVAGFDIAWEGAGESLRAVDRKSSRTIVQVNPQLYRPVDVELLRGDASKARQTLGWEPVMTFDQLVTATMEADLRRFGGRA